VDLEVPDSDVRSEHCQQASISLRSSRTYTNNRQATSLTKALLGTMENARHQRDDARNDYHKAHDLFLEACREGIEANRMFGRDLRGLSSMPRATATEKQAWRSAAERYERARERADKAQEHATLRREQLERASERYDEAQNHYNSIWDAHDQQQREERQRRRSFERKREEYRRANQSRQQQQSEERPRTEQRSYSYSTRPSMPARAERPQRITAGDIETFLTKTKSIDYENLTVFPDPPSEPCGKQACINDRKDRALAACVCNIRTTFSDRGINIKAERLRWHPDRFARCPASVRSTSQKKAQEVFVALSTML
jgi:hypothetical protein